jgi:hypothetical protein
MIFALHLHDFYTIRWHVKRFLISFPLQRSSLSLSLSLSQPVVPFPAALVLSRYFTDILSPPSETASPPLSLSRSLSSCSLPGVEPATLVLSRQSATLYWAILHLRSVSDGFGGWICLSAVILLYRCRLYRQWLFLSLKLLNHIVWIFWWVLIRFEGEKIGLLFVVGWC